VDREARMEPPIQTEYLRSGGATTCGGEGERGQHPHVSVTTVDLQWVQHPCQMY
jgi:hypothetical protein